MRSENIVVTVKIPIPIDKPDVNGVIYSEDAIKKACIDANLRPIEMKNTEGRFVSIGVTNNVEFLEDEKCIKVDGVIYGGGTREEADMVNNIVNKMRITSFGFSSK